MGKYRLSPFDDSWVRQEMWITDEARAAFKARRMAQGPGALSPFERLAAGHRRSKRKRGLNFKVRLRLWEIEKIIGARHGGQIPETDDGDLYIQAVAYSLNALDRLDFDEVLHKWCKRSAPWALARAAEIIQPIITKLFRRKYDLHPDEVARLLCLKMAERTELGIKTIGACDMTAAERKRWARTRKRTRDRSRQERRRRNQGRQTRAEWLASKISASRPWEAEGICRRTWERRVASVSRMVVDTTGDTLATATGETAPGCAQAPLSSSPSQAPFPGSDSASGGAGQRNALHELHVMRSATKGNRDAA